MLIGAMIWRCMELGAIVAHVMENRFRLEVEVGTCGINDVGNGLSHAVIPFLPLLDVVIYVVGQPSLTSDLLITAVRSVQRLLISLPIGPLSVTNDRVKLCCQIADGGWNV